MHPGSWLGVELWGQLDSRADRQPGRLTACRRGNNRPTKQTCYHGRRASKQAMRYRSTIGVRSSLIRRGGL